MCDLEQSSQLKISLRPHFHTGHRYTCSLNLTDFQMQIGNSGSLAFVPYFLYIFCNGKIGNAASTQSFHTCFPGNLFLAPLKGVKQPFNATILISVVSLPKCISYRRKGGEIQRMGLGTVREPLHLGQQYLP